jgi:ATP-binding cassette subfamily C protein
MLRNTNEGAIRLYTNYVLPVLSIVVEVVIVIALVGMMIVVEPAVSAITAATLAVVSAGVYAPIKIVSKRIGAARQEHLGRLNRTFMEGLGGLKEIRILGREDYYAEAFRRHADRYTLADVIDDFMRIMPRYVSEPLLMCGFWSPCWC